MTLTKRPLFLQDKEEQKNPYQKGGSNGQGKGYQKTGRIAISTPETYSSI